ncbi:MAG: fibronectin type III domain-containing protein [Xanthomonadales bacterium]|nr:fibronectin type III domain-containing protein [Xanthomonadales bacterium]
MTGVLTLIVFGTGATVPGAPTIGTATPGNLSATVTFTPPGDNGGSPITSYQVRDFFGTLRGTGAGSPIVVTGLVRDVPYQFKVRAVNAVGQGLDSAFSNSFNAFTVPGATTIGTLTKTGARAASVTFTAPADNGGSSITSYRVEFTDHLGDSVTATGSGSPIATSALVVGRTYWAKVRAINAAGFGAASAQSNTIVA